MELYKTVDGFASAEQSIEKSRFITYIKNVNTREEADAFINEIRKKHRDATHNVPAIVLGENFQIQWASDDGEPQGTSGAPIVQMLVQEKITNVVIVVTRYFGGIKLGTGGLVRAYTSSAKLGLEAAGLCVVKSMSVLKYRTDYSVFNKIQNFSFNFDAIMSEIVYTDVVSFEMTTDPDNKESLKGLITNVSNGTAVLESEEEELVKVKL